MPKFKLDENLPEGLVSVLRAAGYDATSILEEGMSGGTDPHVLSKCQAEGRVLVTLDLDFSDIRAYPPEQYVGQAIPKIRGLFSKLLSVLETETVEHRLWILEESRLRIRGGN